MCNCPAEIHFLKLFLDHSCFQKIGIVLVEVCSFITQFGWTALMSAAAYGRCDVVTELISLGADVDIQDNVSYFYSLNTAKVKDLHT